jgi:hypothetical protein
VSDNPAAFNALRHAAYSFVNRYGKDPVALEEACREFMRITKPEADFSGMSDGEVNRLVSDVVRWVVKRYNPPRRRPERHREERAAAVILAPEIFKIAGEQFGKSTVRNAARVSGQSKSTLARHLARNGIAPRRDKKISQLSRNAQKLLRILDETFDRRAEGILNSAEVMEAIWGAQAAPLAKSTLASRRKALAAILQEIGNCNVGYHILSRDDLIAVRRGRKFTSLSEVDVSMNVGKYTAVQIPRPANATCFWEDPYIVNILELLDMSATGHFYPPERMSSIFFFKNLLLDPTPLLAWVQRAHFSDYGAGTGANLALLSDNIVDPAVRRAVQELSLLVQKLASFAGPLQPCSDAFLMVDFVLDVMDHAQQHSPDSFCRLSCLLSWLREGEETYLELQERLREMLAMEKAGDWQAPTVEELHAFLTLADEGVDEAELHQTKSNPE